MGQALSQHLKADELRGEPAGGSGYYRWRAALEWRVVVKGLSDLASLLKGSAMAFFAQGHKPESDAQLAAGIRHNGSSWPSEIARVYAFRGEKDEAFEWLGKAYQQRDEDLYLIKDDPLFKNVEGDPRYKELLRRMNLPE